MYRCDADAGPTPSLARRARSYFKVPRSVLKINEIRDRVGKPGRRRRVTARLTNATESRVTGEISSKRRSREFLPLLCTSFFSFPASRQANM